MNWTRIQRGRTITHHRVAGARTVLHTTLEHWEVYTSMLISGEPLEITLTATFNGAVMNNVFHYLLGGGDITTAEAIQAFIDDILGNIRDVSDASMIFTNVSVRGVFEGSDSDSQGILFPGTAGLGGDLMAPNLTWAFRLEHDNPDVNAGAKRFSGLTEASTDSGILPSAAALASVVALAANLALPVVGSLATEFLLPVVIGRVGDAISGYKLPVDVIEFVANGWGLVDNAVSNFISTQNSRKRYLSTE